jgi:hypothetical protein
MNDQNHVGQEIRHIFFPEIFVSLPYKPGWKYVGLVNDRKPSAGVSKFSLSSSGFRKPLTQKLYTFRPMLIYIIFIIFMSGTNF